MRTKALLVVFLCSCLPYRGERRMEETWTVTDPAGKTLPGLRVSAEILEGNCMALSRTNTGRVAERLDLLTDAAGRIHTEHAGTWRINPCIFRTDQETCVRHCYIADLPAYKPLNTCEDEDAVEAERGILHFSAARHPRWSEAMLRSFRSSCAQVPMVQRRSTDRARYCACLERRLDGSVQEDVFLRMTDAEVETLIVSVDAKCR